MFLVHFERNYDQIAHFSYTSYANIIDTKKTFLRHGFESCGRKIGTLALHGSIKETMTGLFFRASVKLKAAETSQKFVKLRLGNEKKKSKQERPVLSFVTLP